MKRVLMLAALIAFVGCKGQPPPSLTLPPTKPGDADVKMTGIVINSNKIELNPENSKILFTGTKPGGKHDGGFNKFLGQIVFPSQMGPKEIQIRMDIETDSLFSDDAKLTGHLKTPDFFNVKEHPKATFVSSRVNDGRDDQKPVTVTGDLTILGKKKEIKFDLNISTDRGRLVGSSEFKISRKDFGMSYGEGKIDDEVTVKISIGK
jgi:polyisoprenoid-binding protein YceI